MAFENPKLPMTATVAAADLSAHQFKFAKVDSNGRIAVASVAGEVVDGVLQDKAEAVDRPCTVAKDGESKLVAGAAVTAGMLITTDTSGRGVEAVATNFVRGRARTGASADELFTIDLGFGFKL